MISSVSTLVPRMRLHSRFSATAFSVALMHHRQQARTFCFGNRTNNANCDQRHEMRRRYKEMRHRLALWDQQQPSIDKLPRVYRRPPSHYWWQPRRFFAFSKACNGKEFVPPTTPTINTTGSACPGQDMDAGEHSAWGRAFFRQGDASQHSPWDASFEDMRNYMIQRQAEILKGAGFGSSAKAPSPLTSKTSAPFPDTDYVIDPITNRKVSKASAKLTLDENVDVYAAAEDAESPSSLDGPLAPRSNAFDMADQNLPPTFDELRAYQNVVVDEILSAEANGAPSADSGPVLARPPVVQSEDYIREHLPDLSRPEDNSVEAGPKIDLEELKKYRPVTWNEPHGKPTTPVELGHEGYDPEEVAKYKPVYWNEPDGKPTTPVELGHEGYDPEEVAKYKPVRWNEPHGQPTTLEIELGHEGYDPVEVQKYKPFKYNEPDGKPPASGSAPDLTPELQAYSAVRYQEPDGKPGATVDPVVASLREFDLRSTSSETVENVYCKILRRADEPPVTAETKSIPEHHDGAANETRAKLESAMVRMNANSDAVDKSSSTSVKASKSRARPHMGTKERMQALTDPFSTKPQGLETSFEEECQGKVTWPAYVKVYKAAPREKSANVSASSASSTSPSVYKILAYDPTMQTVNVAETASTVPDMAAPLSPAVAMLRLSNPTKFFPHLKPLQKQGFEIVSGSGDVLIFRKAVSNASPALEVGVVHKTGARSSSPDLTHSAAISSQSSVKAAGTNVRRKEAIFSGPKVHSAEASEQRAPNIAKRMVVGATWVAGVSYALGVVGEHLKGH